MQLPHVSDAPTDQQGIKRLKEEIQTLQKNIEEILKHSNKHVLIIGKNISYFTSYSDALEEGYRLCGLGDFMVQEVNDLTKTYWY